MTEPLFVSYAQNGEDVILWRALRGVPKGRYVDVGAYDPDEHSVTKALYERGWRGVNIEPLPDAVARFREVRPGDETVEAVVAANAGDTLTFHYFPGTGLSTLIDDIAHCTSE